MDHCPHCNRKWDINDMLETWFNLSWLVEEMQSYFTIYTDTNPKKRLIQIPKSNDRDLSKAIADKLVKDHNEKVNPER